MTLPLPGLARANTTPPTPSDVLECVVPGMRLVNPTNEHAHWRVRQKRAKEQRAIAAMVCRSRFGKPPAPPLTITLTRTSPGMLDAHDSLPASCKHVVDGIADWLGIDDSDSRLTWRYSQVRGKRGEYAATIRVEVSR